MIADVVALAVPEAKNVATTCQNGHDRASNIGFDFADVIASAPGHTSAVALQMAFPCLVTSIFRSNESYMHVSSNPRFFIFEMTVRSVSAWWCDNTTEVGSLEPSISEVFP